MTIVTRTGKGSPLTTAEMDNNVTAIDNLITLTGVAEDAVTLGTFTGSTISDSRTVKQALQDLETAHELKAPLASPTFTTLVTLPAAVSAPSLPTYADNAAAVTGGLAVGKIYKTATGEVRVVV